MNLVNLFSALSGLASVRRYSMTRLGSPESVLEHVGMVAFVSNLIAREINHLTDDPVDPSEITFRALVHDLDELVLGDTPRPTKYRDPKIREMFRSLEEWGVRKIVMDLELSDPLQLDVVLRHQAAKHGRDGLIVSIVDAMAVCFKVWEEVILRGNCSMVGHALPVAKQMSELIDKVADRFSDDKVVELLHGIIDQGIKIMARVAEQESDMLGSKMRT